MICLRCGYCCTNLDVAVVNPVAILPDGTVNPESPSPIIFKPAGQRCPHLMYREDKAVCMIHNLACYSESACDQFEQIGRQDDICILGCYYRATKSQ